MALMNTASHILVCRIPLPGFTARPSRNRNDSLSSTQWRRGPRGGAFPAEQESGPSLRSSPHSFVVGRGRKSSRATKNLAECSVKSPCEKPFVSVRPRPPPRFRRGFRGRGRRRERGGWRILVFFTQAQTRWCRIAFILGRVLRVTRTDPEFPPRSGCPPASPRRRGSP